jgi:hypothetical protein
MASLDVNTLIEEVQKQDKSQVAKLALRMFFFFVVVICDEGC